MKTESSNPTQKEEGTQALYVEVYFEIPYNIFNIVSFIVLMQWVQLGATLSDIVTQQKETQQRESNEDFMRMSNRSNHQHVMVNSTIVNSLVNPSQRVQRINERLTTHTARFSKRQKCA